MEIPKIIHLTYKTNDYPQHILEKWRQLNPDYTLTFSDNQDCYNYIEHNFSKEYANFFNRIVHGPNKADFWRLCKLFMEGGVYTDIDIEPFAPIKNIILDTTFCSCIAMNSISIFQAFLAATPRNPLIKACIQSFVKNAETMNLFRSAGCNTAPTGDIYNVLLRLIKRPRLQSNTIYNLKSSSNMINHRVLLLKEVMANPSKGLYGIYVKNHNNQLVLKSRFDGFEEWKNATNIANINANINANNNANINANKINMLNAIIPYNRKNYLIPKRVNGNKRASRINQNSNFMPNNIIKDTY